MRAFLRLNWRERLLVASAGAVVLVVRLGLWLLPFRWWRGILTRASAPDDGSRLVQRCKWSIRPERVGWAVARVSRYVPIASCLTQALAAHFLLVRLGYVACIKIGVARGAASSLEAHAWVECDGWIIVGGSPQSVARFAILPSLKGKLL